MNQAIARFAILQANTIEQKIIFKVKI